MAIILLLSLSMAAAGLAGAEEAQQNPAPVLTMTIIPAQSAAGAGGQIQVLAILNIAPPFHINSNQPNDPALIATSFTLPDPPSGIKLLSVDYPRPEELKVEGEPQPWLVFNDRSALKLTLRIDAAAETGRYQLRGRLDYQACNELVCQMPDRQYADFIIQVVKNPHE